MPYSGGSSTNTGIYYQNWFLALQFSYAFFEQDYIIYPEALRSKSVLIDDIMVKSRKGSHFYSLKFRSPSRNLHWFHSNLCSTSILKDFKDQLDANPGSNLTLISESNCYLFSEVFARAKLATGSHDVHNVLANKFAVSAWESAKKHLKYDDLRLIDFARRVSIRAIPIEEIKSLVKHRFKHVTDENRVAELLFDKAVEASGQKTPVNKITINNWFQEEAIKIKMPL